MTEESEAVFQRSRLRNLDAAFLWLVSLFSLYVSFFTVGFGSGVGIALMPMLVPMFIMPVTEGVLLGVVLKDSLRWRARGWATFLAVIATVVALAAIASVPLGNLSTLDLILTIAGFFFWIIPYLFLFVPWLVRKLILLYGSGLTEIRTDERLRPKGDKKFLLTGAFLGSLAGLGGGLWSLSFFGILGLGGGLWSLSFFGFPLTLLTIGQNVLGWIVLIWFLSIALDLNRKRPEEGQ